MKKLISSMLFVVASFSASSAFAHGVSDLRCKVLNPTEHQDKGDLGFVVNEVRVVGSKGNFTLEVERAPTGAIEILLLPIVSTGSEGTLTTTSASLMWDEGETVFLADSKDGITYTGQVILEQDFGFEVQCVNQASFFE